MNIVNLTDNSASRLKHKDLANGQAYIMSRSEGVIYIKTGSDTSIWFLGGDSLAQIDEYRVVSGNDEVIPVVINDIYFTEVPPRK